MIMINKPLVKFCFPGSPVGSLTSLSEKTSGHFSGGLFHQRYSGLDYLTWPMANLLNFWGFHIPRKSKTKQRMVFRMIHVKDSLLPMGKVWSLDFLGI